MLTPLQHIALQRALEAQNKDGHPCQRISMLTLCKTLSAKELKRRTNMASVSEDQEC
jgi:hypothetical protein